MMYLLLALVVDLKLHNDWRLRREYMLQMRENTYFDQLTKGKRPLIMHLASVLTLKQVGTSFNFTLPIRADWLIHSGLAEHRAVGEKAKFTLDLISHASLPSCVQKHLMNLTGNPVF
jgi:hypothetical protein